MGEMFESEEEFPVSHREVFNELKIDMTDLGNTINADIDVINSPDLLRILDKAAGNISSSDDFSQGEENRQLRLFIDEVRKQHHELGYLEDSTKDELLELVRTLLPATEIPPQPTPDYLFAALDPVLKESRSERLIEQHQIMDAARRVIQKSGVLSMGITILPQIAKKIAEAGDLLLDEARTITVIPEFDKQLFQIVYAILCLAPSASPGSMGKWSDADERQYQLLGAFCEDPSEHDEHTEILADLFIREFELER